MLWNYVRKLLDEHPFLIDVGSATEVQKDHELQPPPYCYLVIDIFSLAIKITKAVFCDHVACWLEVER